jgi:hypothetical protein
MGKRFFDTNTWSKPWFRTLTPADKAAWFYILTNCDLVGVWDADKKLADFCIGEEVDWNLFQAITNGNIEVMENGKWWLVDFCRYQYGMIKSESLSKVQNAIHSLLLYHGLWEKYLHTVSGTVQDKEKEKELDKEKDKEKEKDSYAEGVRMTKAEHSALVAHYGEPVVRLAIDKVAAQQIKTGKAYKSPRGAILQWGIRAALEEIKKNGGIKREAPANPKCDVCGKLCERDHGYWSCTEHGRREELA